MACIQQLLGLTPGSVLFVNHIELRAAACKVSALPAMLSVQSLRFSVKSFNFFFFIDKGWVNTSLQNVPFFFQAL